MRDGAAARAGAVPQLAPEPPPHEVLAPRGRTVSVAGLVAICYFAVAGGPEGTERLIQTAGPLFSVAGFVVVGLLWSAPMALMSAELTACFRENGGYVLWVGAAFGPKAGEMAGWLQFVSSAVDLCLYPGLFVVYLDQMLDVDLAAPATAWALKGIFIATLMGLNLMGIESVGHGSLVFMGCLLTPFVFITVVAFTGVFSGATLLGWRFSTETMLGTLEGTPDWSKFLMVLLVRILHVPRTHACIYRGLCGRKESRAKSFALLCCSRLSALAALGLTVQTRAQSPDRACEAGWLLAQ